MGFYHESLHMGKSTQSSPMLFGGSDVTVSNQHKTLTWSLSHFFGHLQYLPVETCPLFSPSRLVFAFPNPYPRNAIDAGICIRVNKAPGQDGCLWIKGTAE